VDFLFFLEDCQFSSGFMKSLLQLAILFSFSSSLETAQRIGQPVHVQRILSVGSSGLAFFSFFLFFFKVLFPIRFLIFLERTLHFSQVAQKDKQSSQVPFQDRPGFDSRRVCFQKERKKERKIWVVFPVSCFQFPVSVPVSKFSSRFESKKEEEKKGKKRKKKKEKRGNFFFWIFIYFFVPFLPEPKNFCWVQNSTLKDTQLCSGSA